MNRKICVTRKIPQAGVDLLEAAFGPVAANPHDRSLNPSELREFTAGADAILSMLADRIDAAVMDAAGPQLRVIANYAVGYNNIDVQAATDRQVVVTNTPGVLTDATADLAWSLLLTAGRRIVEADAHFRTGTWTGWGPLQFLGMDVAGQTLGVIGAGRIGTAVARRATGFGMRILYTSRQSRSEMEAFGGQRVDLPALLAQSDFISLHVPLTPQTRHMIGPAELARMKPTAILVNTSRGPVIDEQALVAALRDGTIAAAGMDVYENEPTPAPGLVELPNVVVLPHIGSATHETRRKMAVMAAQSIVDALQGRQPDNVVNSAVQPRG